jgi:hypothetical protein
MAGDMVLADCVYGRTIDNSDANARLIAAAPDLLAALQDLLAHRDELGLHDYPAVTRARAVLAKVADMVQP